MERICEPELMDTSEQARVYADADFGAGDLAVVERLVELCGGDPGALLLDLGCGPGNITFPLAARFPGARVLGVDGAAAMLAIAEERRRALGQEEGGSPGAGQGEEAGGPQFRLARLPSAALEQELGGRCSLLVSNSLLHHLGDPQVLWRSLVRLAAPGAWVYVKDLRRPLDEAAARQLLERHAAEAPPLLRHDYLASLRAAFTATEVRRQLAAAGLGTLAVAELEDRYLEVHGRLP